jgi:hypothetical protein
MVLRSFHLHGSRISSSTIRYLFDQQLQKFTYPYASTKDVEAKGKAYSSQKKTSTSRHFKNMKFLHFFIFLWGIFALPDLGPNLAEKNQCGSVFETLK